MISAFRNAPLGLGKVVFNQIAVHALQRPETPKRSFRDDWHALVISGHLQRKRVCSLLERLWRAVKASITGRSTNNQSPASFSDWHQWASDTVRQAIEKCILRPQGRTNAQA